MLKGIGPRIRDPEDLFIPQIYGDKSQRGQVLKPMKVSLVAPVKSPKVNRRKALEKVGGTIPTPMPGQ